MEFLKELGIKEINQGASTGLEWYGSEAGGEINVYSPVDGKFIAKVYQATEEDY